MGGESTLRGVAVGRRNDEKPELGPNGRYTLGRKLNAGHFGKVYIGYDRDKNEYVAMKFIPRGKQVTQYAEREILNHRALHHAHIISFKEVFLTDQDLCIVMEYAAGGDMYELIAKHKCLCEESGRWYFQQLIIAIDYCHKRKVVNRDIKLENLLLDEEKKLLKVCDFGFSKIQGGNHSLPKTIVGTPSYLAPEMLKNLLVKQSYDGKKVDIWTCGVCLFVMLYGYYPFDDPMDKSADRTQNMLKRIARGEVSIPEQQQRPTENGHRTTVPVSAQCRELLGRILEADPKKRMNMNEIMEHPWFLKDLPTGALDYNKGIKTIPERTRTWHMGVQSIEDIKTIVRQAEYCGTLI